MSEEIFLFDIKESKYKLITALGLKYNHINKFPVLAGVDENNFNPYEALHLIEITKIINRHPDVKDFLGSEYISYKKLINIYKRLLPEFNSELLRKYCENQNGLTPDCIITPESKNTWLKGGLSEAFSRKFKIPIHIAQKSYHLDFSTITEIPNDFKFELNIDISEIKNVIIIDECKSKGNTMRCIESNFKGSTNFVEIFYLKSTP